LLLVMLGSVTLDTPIVGIGHKSRGTELADGLMILHNAGRVARTHLAFTRVLALQIDAGLMARTAAVLETDGDAGVAAGGADTHSLVVQNLALLAGVTGSGAVTGVYTTSLVTGLVAGTLFMAATLQLTVRTREDTGLVDHQRVLALAHRLVSADLAHLVAVAGEPGAGIVALTGLSVAGLGQRTLLVTGAAIMNHGMDDWRSAGGVRSTGHLRPANVTLSTLAARPV
jgi:hypothetical protein